MRTNERRTKTVPVGPTPLTIHLCAQFIIHRSSFIVHHSSSWHLINGLSQSSATRLSRPVPQTENPLALSQSHSDHGKRLDFLRTAYRRSVRSLGKLALKGPKTVSVLG